MGYQLIEHIEVGAGGVSSIEFTGIPQDGVDLVLMLSLRGDTNPDMRFNNDSSANYSYTLMRGFGSGITNDAAGAQNRIYLTALSNNQSTTTANTFSNVKIYISNYASSVAKSVSIDGVTENNATSAVATISAESWNNSSSITSIRVFTNPINEFSTASLYKITAD